MKAEIRRSVEPFNDIYTHDCFMNSLLCAARHYKLNYPMLTLHRIFFYALEGEQLEGRSIIMFPIDELALALGMEVYKEKDDIRNWKEEHDRVLKRGNIIVALLDDYYNPLRLDIYNKEHLPHYTLIYNMDNRNELLSVVESRYRTTVSYKNMKMRYVDYEKSHFQTETLHKYILKKSKCNLEIPYKDIYIHMSVQLAEQSIANLHNYICYLSQNEVTEKKEWLKNLNDICNQVKVERYIYDKVFCNKHLSSISADIFMTWYLVRTYVVKLSMIKQSDTIGLRIIASLKKIEKLERKKLSILYAYTIGT
ncbi:hypothetical protein AN1V17_06070 [Vallitalea sediminicola]